MLSKMNMDRDRGILTPADRRFLTGREELEGNAKRQARQRIRDRLKNALIDFSILQWSLSEEDRDLVAGDIFGHGKSDLWDGYVDMYAFFYRLSNERGHTLKPEIRHAVQRVEEQRQADRGKTVDITVTFDVEKEIIYDHSDLHEKWETGESMTPDEMETLLFESDYFGHLREKAKWEMFGDFLNGDLDVECRVEENNDGPTQA